MDYSVKPVDRLSSLCMALIPSRRTVRVSAILLPYRVMLPQARESTTTGPQNDLGWKGQDGALRWSDPGMLPVLWALDTLRSS